MGVTVAAETAYPISLHECFQHRIDQCVFVGITERQRNLFTGVCNLLWVLRPLHSQEFIISPWIIALTKAPAIDVDEM
jgi:hypothetical protein